MTTTHPPRSQMAVGSSSLAFTQPFAPNTNPLNRPCTSRYLQPPSSRPHLPPFTPEPYGIQPYQPPSLSFSGPRYLKIELPRFFGDDPYGWIAMAEEFLEYHKVEDHRRVTTAGLHLGGDAAHWLRWFKKRYPLSSWATFSTQLLQRFGPSDSLNFNMAMSHISQTTTVEAYVGHFICLSCPIPDWTDAQLLGAFLGDLKDELQDDVVAQRPTSLARAIELAGIYEHKQGRRLVARFGFFRASSYNPQPPSSLPTNPSSITTSLQPTPTTPNLPPSKPVLRLTQAEMCALREQGLCFNCDDQYRPGHRCRQSHIFLLLAEDDNPDPTPESDETVPRTPAIVEHLEHLLALHAISATKRAHGCAMHLEGFINHILIQVFIDSRADQSFLNP